MNFVSRITQKTKLIGLLGYPLTHSFSPIIQNTAFKITGLDYVYIAMPVRPRELWNAVQGVKALHIAGGNVTIPHKENILPYMDYLTDEAELVGAVNTFFWAENKYLIGDNTDVIGFIESLRSFKINVLGKTVAIVGSGGAARAAAVALAQLCAQEVILVARSVDPAMKLINDMKNIFPETIWVHHTGQTAMFASDLGRVFLLINATPVGMYPNVDSSPLDKGMFRLLPPNAHVYDMVYNPVETQFLKQASSLGLQTHNGLELLLYQGAASFERWTGKQAPIDKMRQVLIEQINNFNKEKPELIDIYDKQ